MKIAFLITRGDSLGGAQIHVRDMSVALRDDGHEVLVILGGEGSFSQALEALRIPYTICRHLVRPIAPMEDLHALGEIIDILKRHRPDLLSTHSSKAGWLGRAAGRLTGVPTLFTAHGWPFTGGIPCRRKALYRLAETCMGSLSRKVITVCEEDRLVAVRQRVISSGRVETIHNGVHDVASEFAADPSRQPPRLIMVARFQEQKDHPLLIEMLTQFRNLDWKLDLVGDGPRQAKMEQAVVHAGLQERVHFLGERSDVAACLAGCQLFVLLSRWEGFPRSILEAMRGGLPVLATNVGGIREAVIHGKTGYVCELDDREGLRRQLEDLLVNPGLRAQFGRAGRAFYEQRFTFQRMYRQTLNVYRTILGQ